jgi:hypothetical protein
MVLLFFPTLEFHTADVLIQLFAGTIVKMWGNRQRLNETPPFHYKSFNDIPITFALYPYIQLYTTDAEAGIFHCSDNVQLMTLIWTDTMLTDYLSAQRDARSK